jgi:energy-coupling factor transport system ATP-binding protein
METFEIIKFTFRYPGERKAVLNELDLTVHSGEFVALCGKSGSGKSTLLRNLKTPLAPEGRKKGEILFRGRPIEHTSFREQAQRIGYVLQDPDNQIVTDKVWRELSFGLENLGYDSGYIRLRVAEMASFFGIQTWFREDVASLSGGQKQLLNLAAIMTMNPDVLLLDEPTAQLDPIAASDFLDTLRKINTEIGTSIILSEQRLENVLPMADRVVALDQGRVIADAPPKRAGVILAQQGHDMFRAMPTPMRIFMDIEMDDALKLKLSGAPAVQNVGFPITVREGREWLTALFQERKISKDIVIRPPEEASRPAVVMKDVWFRYEKDGLDAVRDLSVEFPEAKLSCIVGGNATGKSTALKLLAGLKRPYRGKIFINGVNIGKIPPKERSRKLIGLLPQNPQTILTRSTVRLDLEEVLITLKKPDGGRFSQQERDGRIAGIASLLEVDELLDRHPYDLSGGERQRAALAKLLLLEPELLLLDEPTKGMDGHFKEKLAMIIKALLSQGKTVVMVSHDVEFCAKYANFCALFFDGGVVTSGAPGPFFSGNSYYTTVANRMSRHIFENAVTPKEVIDLCRENIMK